MATDLNVVVDINPRVFDATEAIVRRALGGRLDSAALNADARLACRLPGTAPNRPATSAPAPAVADNEAGRGKDGN